MNPRKLDRLRRALSIVTSMVLLSCSTSALADLVMPFRIVGDADNEADETGFGQVDAVYLIGTYEVTNGQYAEFLSSVAATDTHGLYTGGMDIERAGSPGTYRYSTPAENEPVSRVSWYAAVRFCNWLHNGQPTGPQSPGTTEDGAYTFVDATTVGPRNPEARVFLPTESEWYKAAYHQGGAEPGYTTYPTGSEEPPQPAVPGGGTNRANYGLAVGAPVEVGAFPDSNSWYGTYDQGGNVWEWNETAIGRDRGLRGGSWDDYELLMEACYRDSDAPGAKIEFVGFRVAAAAPETTWFRRADSNQDSKIDISDAISVLGYLFAGDSTPACLSAADINDDGAVDISDPVALLTHLFAGGAALPQPTTACGPDPSRDELGCESFAECGGR